MRTTRRLSSSIVFQWGEYVLAEDPKGRQRLFRLMEGSVFNSLSGQMKHEDIVGKIPYQKFKTHIGSSVWLRRPRLAEYVCLMQRAATPTYPKDIWAMMGYMDIGGGATVIEAGTGSGAMTLHLSNHVGQSGRIYSFETVTKHQAQAKSNYNNWRHSWDKSHPDNPWPDNVHFIEADVSDAQEHIHSCSVDAVALDLVSPYLVVDKLVNVLRPGSMLAAYLPNVMQVLDLRLRLDEGQLPLDWVAVVEVVHRDWMVKPAVSKHRAAAQRLAQSDDRIDHFPRYISRPSHLQDPHTVGRLAILNLQNHKTQLKHQKPQLDKNNCIACFTH